MEKVNTFTLFCNGYYLLGQISSLRLSIDETGVAVYFGQMITILIHRTDALKFLYEISKLWLFKFAKDQRGGLGAPLGPRGPPPLPLYLKKL